MGLHQSIFIIWIFMIVVQCTKHKLYCRTEATATPQPAARLLEPPSIGRRNLAPRDERAKVELDACCGPKPFYTGFSTCCMGKPIRRSSRRCCISGPHVPKHSICNCYPHSDWIKTEKNKFEELRIRTISLMEDVITAKERLMKIIDEKERLVGELDAKASDLYRSFLRSINVDRGEDLKEVQYIYELVTFLHSNEEVSFERSLNEEKFIGLPESPVRRDVPMSLHRQLESAAKMGLLELVNSLMDRVKSKKISLSYAIQKIKAAGQESIIESDFWQLPLKKQNFGRGGSVVEEEISSDETELNTGAIVQERNNVLEQINNENKFIIASMSRAEELEKMTQVSKSGEKVAMQMIDLLIEALEMALEIEDEQRALELEAELESEGGSFDSIRLTANNFKINPDLEHEMIEPGCNVTSWTNNFSNMETETDNGETQLRKIMRFISRIRRLVNTRGNDLESQWHPRFPPELEP
ncbi:uncharacterized protein LOC120347181 [Styela clava]